MYQEPAHQPSSREPGKGDGWTRGAARALQHLRLRRVLARRRHGGRGAAAAAGHGPARLRRQQLRPPRDEPDERLHPRHRGGEIKT